MRDGWDDIVLTRRAAIGLVLAPLADTAIAGSRNIKDVAMSFPATVGLERAQVGESPWWDPLRGQLWWVDTFAPAVLRTSIDGTTTRTVTHELTGGVALCDDQSLIVAMETGLFLLDPAQGSAPLFHSAPTDLPPTHRFNDLTVDPCGRLIIGTMRKSQLGPPEPTGTLYSFSSGRWTVLLKGLTTINGLAFSPDGDRIYWSDSFTSINRIWHAPYDKKNGAMGPAVAFVEMSKYRGRPDGAAMDEAGGYWIAGVGGGCLHRFLPSGALDRTIDLPVEHPTKPAFGGAGLDRLFVTSLSVRASKIHPELAGALVTLAAPFRGHAVPSYRLGERDR